MTIKLQTFLAFVALGTAIQLNSTFPQLGTLTHVVLINAKDNHCAGSLISENTVLTSAHCLVHVKAREVRVQAGVIDVTRADENMQERRGLHIFIHPEYRPGRLAGYDVGLLRVEENFTFNQVVFKVELWDRDWPVTEEPTGMLCQASGWYEDQMRQIKLRMWDMVAHHGEKACPCTKRYQWKRMVCAEPDDQLEELCKSDKGGALICRDKAVGIIHMTRERRTCKNPDYPDCNPEAPRGIQYYQFLCPVNDWLRMYVNHLPPKPISCGASVLRWTLLLSVVMLINYFGAV